ncbi:MAG TPA: hypothetical protein VIN07_13540 [Flavipsychrobacter sp.]
MRKIERLYYGYYLWAIKTKWDTVPEYTALLSLAGVVFLNLLTVFFWVYVQWGISVIGFISPPMRIVFVLGYLAAFVLIFFGDKRYKRVISEMNSKAEWETRRAKKVSLVYAICSIVLLLAALIIGSLISN